MTQASLAQNSENFGALIFDPVPIREEVRDEDALLLEFTPSASLNAEEAQELQLASPLSTTLSIVEYQQSILSQVLENGPYDESLAEDLLALGDIYQQQGDSEEALNTYSEALYIKRLNDGLYSPTQGPILGQIVASHLSNGDLRAANEQQEYAFYLQSKMYSPRSPEMLPALEVFANWNIFAFGMTQGILPTEYQGDFSPGSGFYHPVERQYFERKSIRSARNTYLSMSEILLDNYGSNDRRLLEVQERLAMVNYLIAGTIDPIGHRDGRKALQRRVDYLREMDNASSQELATALAELGDWDMIFRRRSSALALYEEANQTFRPLDMLDEGADGLIRPRLPVSIPAFLAMPYSRAANEVPEGLVLDYKGYIDVEFLVNRYGRTASLEVLGMSEQTAPTVETILVTQLRRAQFRPGVIDGELGKATPYKLRYYYTY
jgi:tetratricopeptide (TPR) repeat protein